MADLLSQFAQIVARHPERIAIVNGDGQAVSFAELQARASGLAATWSRAGVRRGDRVLLAMGISSDLYASLAALWSLGATVVLPEPALGLAGLRHAVKTTNVSSFCATGVYRAIKLAVPELWFKPRLKMTEGDSSASLTAANPDDTALISFTSGTTGAPKAIPRSHAFLMAQHDAVAPLLHSDQPERDLVAFPVFALINLASGRTSVLPSWKMSRLGRLSAAQLADWIVDQQVSRALLPPALCQKLAQTRPLENLKDVFTGGGPIFPDTLNAVQNTHPNLNITCVYGSTEAEPIAHLRACDITPHDLNAMQDGQGLLVGRATEGTQVRIVNNEILVAGDHVNQGYLNPKHDVENKVHHDGTIWHRTGDAGRLDENGRLWLLGRIGTDVNLNGRLTYPFAVEIAVRQWAGVTSCALMTLKNVPLLVIEGDAKLQSTWETEARKLGIAQLRHVKAIPMDKRHASKVDRNALLRQLDR